MCYFAIGHRIASQQSSFVRHDNQRSGLGSRIGWVILIDMEFWVRLGSQNEVQLVPRFQGRFVYRNRPGDWALRFTKWASANRGLGGSIKTFELGFDFFATNRNARFLTNLTIDLETQRSRRCTERSAKRHWSSPRNRIVVLLDSHPLKSSLIQRHLEGRIRSKWTSQNDPRRRE